jgi:septum formation protein
VSAAPRVVLASRSPARLTTLRAAGIDPEVVVSGFDEDSIQLTDPAELVAALARAKAESVTAGLPSERDVLVIGCDSVLDFEGEVHGKPSGPGQAAERWRRIRGRSGVLRTGHHLVLRRGGQVSCRTAVESTRVWFADLSDDEIAAYVATGEPVEVAGGFTIDGLGGAYITRLDGDPHAVVGISLPLLRTMVGELGLPWHSLWRR